MKFLITENKLGQIIFKYLDDKNFIVGEPKSILSSYIFFIENKNSKYATIKIIKGHNKIISRVSSKLIEEVGLFFSISLEDSLSHIIDWIENKLNIEINETYGVGSGSLTNYMNYRMD
jgi:hypothetical protein